MKTTSPWIINGTWDALIFLNFAWLLPLVGAAVFFKFDAALLVLALTVIFVPLRDTHTFSPILALFTRSEIREYFLNDRRLVWQFAMLIAVPLSIIPVSWCIPWHEVLGEYGSFINPIGMFAIGYAILTYWHVSLQNFGLLSLYRRAQGNSHEGKKRIDLWFSLLIFFFLTLVAFLGREVSWINPWAMRIFLFSVAVAVSAFAILNDKEILSLPRLMFMVSSAFVPVLLYDNFILVYMVVVILNHCLVELCLSTKMVRSQQAWYRQSRFLIWLALVMILGILLYQSDLRRDIIARSASFKIYRLYAGTMSLKDLLTGLFVAVIYSIGLLHFFSDRVLFQMSRPNYPKKVIRQWDADPVGY